jgi:hypothetical protein
MVAETATSAILNFSDLSSTESSFRGHDGSTLERILVLICVDERNRTTVPCGRYSHLSISEGSSVPSFVAAIPNDSFIALAI